VLYHWVVSVVIALLIHSETGGDLSLHHPLSRYQSHLWTAIQEWSHSTTMIEHDPNVAWPQTAPDELGIPSTEAVTAADNSDDDDDDEYIGMGDYQLPLSYEVSALLDNAKREIDTSDIESDDMEDVDVIYS
jgi:hypothetical protein